MSNIPTIDSLHKERTSKEKSKYDIMNIVLNKCVEKIVYTNRHTDKTYVIFEVPKILIGYPMYDMKSCILFIIQQLTNSGYLINFIEPFYLYIDWGSIKPIKKKSSESLKEQTKSLLKHFPNTSKIEYIYEDITSNTNKKNKKKK
jgi:hypothetical protein